MTPDRAAERAVIGALLLGPARFTDVREWLRPDDFHGTAERQGYEAICRVAQRGETLSAEAVDRDLRSARDDAPVLADGSYLIECMQSCPTPNRAAVYGRMVLEASIRRRVAAQAVGLRQRAEMALTSHDLTLTFARVDSVRRDVERLHQREAQAARAYSPSPLRAVSLHPVQRFARAEDVPAERMAVQALVEQPRALAVVNRWLAATDFGDRECSALYIELTSMHDAGEPIDKLTLAWRSARIGLEGPVCAWLLRQRDGSDSVQDPVHACRRVLQQSVRAAVVATAESLQRLSVNAPDSVTAEAYARLNNLWPQQRRLVKASLHRT